MCHSCEASDYHAQGHSVGQENPWREGLIKNLSNTTSSTFLCITKNQNHIPCKLHISSIICVLSSLACTLFCLFNIKNMFPIPT